MGQKHKKYDVVVLGSGIGGLCSAALLANKGYKTLVIEKLPIIGGRCSTLTYKGFKIPTGVVAVPMSGTLTTSAISFLRSKLANFQQENIFWLIKEV